jgi:hypothetical protein
MAKRKSKPVVSYRLLTATTHTPTGVKYAAGVVVGADHFSHLDHHQVNVLVDLAVIEMVVNDDVEDSEEDSKDG